LSLPLFRVEVRPEREQERVRVIPHGELDVATVPRLEAEIARLRSQEFATILLDLRQLTFMDSTGLGLLLRLHEEARSDGFRFAIADREGPVRRLLALTGTAGWFQYVKD
jgi:anti-sigma B factor antagonist